MSALAYYDRITCQYVVYYVLGTTHTQALGLRNWYGVDLVRVRIWYGADLVRVRNWYGADLLRVQNWYGAE